MKKVIISAAILFSALFNINATAQTQTKLGVKLNANLTNVKLTDLQGVKEEFNPGASVGGFVKIQFNENFALQPELMFNYTEAKVKQSGESLKFKYAAVEIPVYALGQIKAGTGKVFLGAGPHIGYGFSADSATEHLPAGSPGENKLEMDHWYMGGSAIAGYEFRNGLSVHAGYQLGRDLSSSSNGSKVNTQTISLGVGYKF